MKDVARTHIISRPRDPHRKRYLLQVIAPDGAIEKEVPSHSIGYLRGLVPPSAELTDCCADGIVEVYEERAA